MPALVDVVSAVSLPSVILHLTILAGAVVMASRLLAWLLKPLQQPRVFAEIFVGLLLGPSLLGWLAPQASSWLAPPEIIPALNEITRMGIVVFMFTMGAEFDLSKLKHNQARIGFVSAAGIFIPFMLGMPLAEWLYDGFGGANVSHLTFALFMGTALAITAFPVLTRILAEQKIANTGFGNFVQACAAIDDVTAWTALALISVVANSGSRSYLTTAGSIAVFLAGMRFVVRPVLAWLPAHRPVLSRVAIVVIVATSTWAADHVGVHVIFGAFLAGVLLPRNGLVPGRMLQRLKDFTTIAILPLFFAQTGLRTHLEMIGGIEGYVALAGIISVATLGKLGGVTAAARMSGCTWQTSWALGAAMNARGLVGLIILNAGLELGILGSRLYALMVLMSLVTTAAAGPALHLYRTSQMRRPANQRFLITGESCERASLIAREV